MVCENDLIFVDVALCENAQWSDIGLGDRCVRFKVLFGAFYGKTLRTSRERTNFAISRIKLHIDIIEEVLRSGKEFLLEPRILSFVCFTYPAEIFQVFCRYGGHL